MVPKTVFWSVTTLVLLAGCGAVAAELPSDMPLCKPKRTVLQIDYSPLNGGYPRKPPDGYVEFGFAVSRTGKVEQIVVLSSTAHWPKGEALAREVLSHALFEAPERSCTQSMRFTFKAE